MLDHVESLGLPSVRHGGIIRLKTQSVTVFLLKKFLTTGSTSLGPLTTGSACCSYGRSGSNVFGFDCLTIPGAACKMTPS